MTERLRAEFKALLSGKNRSQIGRDAGINRTRIAQVIGEHNDISMSVFEGIVAAAGGEVTLRRTLDSELSVLFGALPDEDQRLVLRLARALPAADKNMRATLRAVVGVAEGREPAASDRGTG